MTALSGPLSVSGSAILDAAGTPVRLAGVNWGGAQQDECVPYGLDKLDRHEIIGRIISWGLNHVRVPFALGTFVNSSGTPKTAPAKASRLTANPDLQGMTPAGVYAQLIADITAAGLYAIPNAHLKWPGWCCSQADNAGLWYNDNWPSATFTNTWLLVAGLFAGNPLVGYDLHNEPRPATIGGQLRTPTWGTGNGGSFPTDIRAMYQSTIGRIRAVHPGALCFCEGLGYAADLTGWASHPVTGAGVVASIHDYPWFHPAGQPKAGYYQQMDAAAGYLVQDGIAPLWIGEFGANTDVPLAAMQSGWLPQIVSYIADRGLHWCWWELGATAVLGTEPSTNTVKMQAGQREAFSLTAGQDWAGTQADLLAMLAPVIP